ncbi:MAG: mechanosensitive ion channel domain-containing protein [Ottowia sp.]
MIIQNPGYRIWQSAALALVFFVLRYVLEVVGTSLPDNGLAASWHKYLPLLDKLTAALLTVTVIYLVSRIVEKVIDNAAEIAGTRYNLIRVVRLMTFVLMAIVVASFLFQNLYAAAVSFGLLSLILGFALQAPIASFIGWLYLVFRRPYQVGDRIQLAALRGDVVAIGYLDTTLAECSGSYLGNDRLSGRMIHFPNSVVLKSDVINYSGPFRPFIWNETALQIAYTSDLDFVEACLVDAANRDFSSHYRQAVSEQTQATVYFRVNTYAWLEAVVSYPVRPNDTTGRRNRILRNALPALNQAPRRAQFPAGAKR